MQEKNNMSTFVVALAGNKCDIEKENHEIKPEMVSDYVKSQSFESENLILKHTSAKTGEGVKEIFHEIAQKIVKIKFNEHL